jgi:hypothetical protein
VFDLEKEIADAIAEIDGEVDGDEFGAGEAVVFVYGKDADELWEAIEPVITEYELPGGGFVRTA